jgi:hypothetical protein
MRIGSGLSLSLQVGTGYGAAPVAPLAVAFTSPAPAAEIPTDSQTTIIMSVTPGADTVQVYRVYPTQPIGYATIVSGTASLDYTPDITHHGSYTFVAVASRGAETATASLAVSISAVPLSGLWAANSGQVWDFRAIADAVGAAVGTIAPIEGSGSMVPTASPVVRIGQGLRKVVEYITASSQYQMAPTTMPNGIRQPWTIVWRGLIQVGSARAISFGDSAQSATNILEFSFTSGKQLQVLARALGGSLVTCTFAFDFDVPSLTTRTIIVTSNGTQAWCYIDGVADASNPQACDMGAFSLGVNRVALAARGTSSLGGYATGNSQWAAGMRRQVSGAEALTISNRLAAADLPPVVGTPIMFLGHSLVDGGTTGGWRKPVVDFISANSLALTPVGPYASGSFAANRHNGQGGNNMAAMIAQNITPHIGSGKAYQPRCCAIMCWANDVDEVGISTATLLSRYTSLLDALDAAGVSGDAAFRIIAPKTAEPYDPAQSASAAARITELNAPGGIDSVHAAYNAAHPTRQLIEWDPYAAIGGWNAPSYGTDRVHPLPLTSGYYKFASAATHGFIANAGAYLISIG